MSRDAGCELLFLASDRNAIVPAMGSRGVVGNLLGRLIGFLSDVEDYFFGPEMLPEEVDPQFDGMPKCEVDIEMSESPIDDDDAADVIRRSAAVDLVEPDTYGYLLFTLKKPSKVSPQGEVDVKGFILPQWWPAFIDMLNQTASIGLDIAKSTGTD